MWTNESEIIRTKVIIYCIIITISFIHKNNYVLLSNFHTFFEKAVDYLDLLRKMIWNTHSNIKFIQIYNKI